MYQDKRTIQRIEPIRRRNQRVLARAQLASVPLLGMALILVHASTWKLAPYITPSLSIIGIAFMLFSGCSKLLSPISLWYILPAKKSHNIKHFINHMSLSLKCCFSCLCLTSRERSKWFSTSFALWSDHHQTSQQTRCRVFSSKDSPPSELKAEKTEKVWVS